MLTSLYLFLYVYFSTYITDFIFSNFIGTTYMYIYSFAYVDDRLSFNSIITISTLLIMFSAVSLPITYSLHLLFHLHCQFYFLRFSIHHIYSFACLVTLVLFDYLVTISIFSLMLSTVSFEIF